MPTGARIVLYGFDSSTVVYYSRHDSKRAPGKRPQEALRLLAEHPGSRLVTTERWWPMLPADDLTVVRRAGPYVLAELRGASRAGVTGSSPASAPAAAAAPKPARPPEPAPPDSRTGNGGR